MDSGNFGGSFKPQTKANGLENSVTVAGLSASATSGTLPARDANYGQLQISNKSTSWAAINVGAVGLAAATVALSYPVAPGAAIVISIDLYVTTMSLIMDTANGNVVFTLGSGS